MFIIPCILILIGLAVDCLFIVCEFKNKMNSATFLKGLAASFFVILGAVMYRNNPSSYGFLIVLGLLLGMLGDIFLEARMCIEGKSSNKVFAVGILSFLAGHILYIVSLLKTNSSAWWIALIICAVLSLCAIPPLMKKISAPSAGLKFFGYVYLTIVIAMMSSAVAVLVKSGAMIWNILFVIGSVFFVVSDFIMIYNSFGPKKTKVLRATNLLTYYAGQVIIALTVFFFAV